LAGFQQSLSTVNPITVLASNSGANMTRFDPATQSAYYNSTGNEVAESGAALWNSVVANVNAYRTAYLMSGSDMSWIAAFTQLYVYLVVHLM
jgi:hypothetical protein